MKLAITGCSGRVGRVVVREALRRGHTVVGIDRVTPVDWTKSNIFVFIQTDLENFDTALNALRGCDGVIHLAAIPTPTDYKVASHNSNVIISWNVLRSCAELGINRVAQASSVNVITMVYSQSPNIHYFPIDENHPCLPDEPYGLSKVICELQADTLVRRYRSMKIASLRLHFSVPERSVAHKSNPNSPIKDLWGYVQEDSAADAFLLAVTEETNKWSGHEAFFIVAPATAFPEPSKYLKETYWPDVPILEGKELIGNQSFFDCGKAERLLGWKHRDFQEAR